MKFSELNEHNLTEYHHGVCTCGGGGPERGCMWCQIYHAAKPAVSGELQWLRMVAAKVRYLAILSDHGVMTSEDAVATLAEEVDGNDWAAGCPECGNQGGVNLGMHTHDCPREPAPNQTPVPR